MTIEIENVRSEHLARVHELNEGALPNVSSVTLDEVHRFAERAAYFRVAVAETELLGFLIGLTPETDYESPNFLWFRQRYPSFVYIDRVVVAEEARRRGVGGLFYRDLESFATQFAPILTCEVNLQPPNEGSLAFHRGFGFEAVGTQRTEGGRKTVSLLAKNLSPRP